jgi:hypothetical protein
LEQVSQNAFHNSRERSKEISPEIVKPLVQKWASRLKALLSRLSTDASFVSLTYPDSSLGPLIEPDNPDEIIKDVYAWLFDRSTPFHIMWIHGENVSQTNLVGQVIAGVSHELGILSTSFFSSVVDGLEDTVDSACAIPTLAYQLAQNIPDPRLAIAHAVVNDRSIFNLEVQTQIQRLITEPLSRVAGPKSVPRVLLILGPEYFSNAHHFQSSFLHDFADALSSMRQIVLQRPVKARLWWGKELEIIRKMEEVKRKEEQVRQKEEQVRQKEEQVRQKEVKTQQKEEEIRRRETDVRQREMKVQKGKTIPRKVEEDLPKPHSDQSWESSDQGWKTERMNPARRTTFG